MNDTSSPASRYPGLQAQAEALRAGSVTAAELVGQTIEAIESSQDTLNCFRIVRGEAARAEADEADRRLAAGERLPLLGVPVAMKDEMDFAGLPTAFGTGCHREPATADCEMVRRLKAAGAIIVGKTHSSELGQWPLTGGPELGHVHNPWKRGYTPGGSSGGSSAAVAAGLVPAAMGSDGAGSVRIPAAWTNLVGIKPQRGRIPTWPEPEMFNGLTVLGPLACTVADAALLLDTVAGSHPDDLHQPPERTVSDAVGRDPGTLRIGLSFDIPFTGTPTRLDPQVRAAVQSVADTLTGLGHELVMDDPAYELLLGGSFLPRSLAALDGWRRRFPDPEKLEKRTLDNARLGRLLSGLPLKAARKVEPWLQRRVGRVFERVDVVLAPTTATPPPAVDAIDGLSEWQTSKVITAACPYTFPWNVLGWPSISVPAGFSDDGLPLGAQLMGNADTEPLLVSLAAQLESALGWARHRPTPWW